VKKHWFWVFLSALALSLALVQLVSSRDLLSHQIFDAQHYINCCKLFRNLTDAPAVAATSLRLNGPVMPLLSLVASICGGLLPDGQIVATPFVLVMILLYVSTVSLVAVFAAWLTRSRWWGLVAGLAYALYLPAQLASNLFLSETPTALLLLAATWAPVVVLACLRLKRFGQASVAALLCGVLVAAIAMVKTALLPGMLVLTLVLLLAVPRSMSRRVLPLGLLGASLVFGSYAACLNALGGGLELMPSRDPAMNMAVGCDYEVDAWECKPMPFITYQGTFQKPLITLSQAIKSNPQAFCFLTLTKALRAWNMPWLSCRRVCFGWPDWLPRMEHCLFVALGAVTLILTAGSIKLKRVMSCRNLAMVGLISAICSHFVFVVFESQPRYSFTAMPLLVVLGVSGLVQFWWRRKMILSIGTLLLCIVLFWMSTNQSPIVNDDKAISGFRLLFDPACAGNKCAQYVIFSAKDFDQRLPVTLQINQEQLVTQAKPLVDISDFAYKAIAAQMAITVCQAKELKGAGQLWDWYAIALPDEVNTMIERDAKVSIIFSASGAFRSQTSVLNTDGMVTLPALYYRSLSRLESSPDGFELRPPVQVRLAHKAGLMAAQRVPLVFFASKDSRVPHNDRWTIYLAKNVAVLESNR